MEKPSKVTIAKHVRKLEVVANKRKGKVLPSYSWLRDHGFFRSYEVMLAAPKAFSHLKRASAR